MRRVCFLLLAILIAAQAVFSQSDNSRFAPFVTNLKAETDGRTVVLTWKDSSSVRGSVFVFRSRTPFSGSGQAYQYQGIEVPYGRQTYSEVAILGEWYYFVAASDEGRQKYELLIPFNNMVNIKNDGAPHTANATSFAVPQAMPQAYAGNTALPYGTASGDIRGITANSQGSFIVISFLSSSPGKNAVLYRSIQPIRTAGDLLTATVLQLGVTSPYNDRATPGVPYYYAVVFEEDIRVGRTAIVPGSNATYLPAEISARQNSTYAPPSAPNAPPNYQAYSPAQGIPPYTATNESWGPVPQTAPRQNWTQLQQGNGTMLNGDNRLLPPNPLSAAPDIREPRVFNQDLSASQINQDDYELSAIVKGPFMWRNWNVAKQNLWKYLSITRSRTVDSRAHFYLGQAYYFNGEYQNALTEFLSVQSVYHKEVDPWVKACLNRLGR